MDLVKPEVAAEILAAIKSAKRILLHCHPRADADSVASVLALKAALEGLGKTVTAIRGDTPLPEYLAVLPDFAAIQSKNYFEIDPTEFDLFIILDAGQPNRISELQPVVFPPTLRTIVIDHHATISALSADATRFGEINLLEPRAAATCELLAELFDVWRLTITPEIALCLWTGLWGDTGGFRHPNVTPNTLTVAARLVAAVGQPRLSHLIAALEGEEELGQLRFRGLAFSHLEPLFNGQAILSLVPHQLLLDHQITVADIGGSGVAGLLKTVRGCQVGVLVTEESPGKFKVSFRSRDGERFDVSQAAARLGGGGHRAAAGVAFAAASAPEARERVINTLAPLFAAEMVKSN